MKCKPVHLSKRCVGQSLPPLIHFVCTSKNDSANSASILKISDTIIPAATTTAPMSRFLASLVSVTGWPGKFSLKAPVTQYSFQNVSTSSAAQLAPSSLLIVSRLSVWLCLSYSCLRQLYELHHQVQCRKFSVIASCGSQCRHQAH